MKFEILITKIILLSTFCECGSYTKFLSPSNQFQPTIQALTDVVKMFFIEQNITHFDILIWNMKDTETGEIIDYVRKQIATHSTNIKIIPQNVSIVNIIGKKMLIHP
jgi:hypothetical protein